MKTQQTFDAMRQLPVDIPAEKVEQFVLAHVAAGTIAATAVAGAKKFAILTHLNTIVMTTAAAATLTTLAVVFYPGDADKTFADNAPVPTEQTQAIFVQPETEDEAPAVDTPATKTEQPKPATTTTRVIVITNNDTVSNTTTTSTSAEPPQVIIVQGRQPKPRANPADYMFTYYQPEPFDEQEMEDLEAAHAELANAEAELAEAQAGLQQAEANMQYAQAQLEAEHAQAQAEMERAAAEAEMAAAHAEMEAAQAESAAPMGQCQHDNQLLSVIEEALLADSLIDDKQHYSFSFNDRSLTVNGKRQSEAAWEKYKDLITSNSDYRISKRFHYAISKSGKSVSVTINN